MYVLGPIQECRGMLKNLKELCMECIEKSLDHHKPVCLAIQQGTVKSRRHHEYQKGRNARANLDFQWHSVHVFSEEAHELAEKWMRREFVKDGNPKSLD